MSFFGRLRGKLVATASEGSSSSVAALLEESAAARRSGDLVRAEQTARQAIAADENRADSWCALAAAAIDSGAFDLASESLERASAINPRCDGLYNLKGIASWMQGDLEGALANYRQAVDVDKNPSKALFNLALVHRARGELDAAIDALRGTISADPRAEDRNALLGDVLMEAVRLEEAIGAYDAEIDGNPASTGAWSGRGTALLAQGRVQDALESFETAIALDPENYTAQGNRLLALQYDPDISPEALFDAHRSCNAMLCGLISRKVPDDFASPGRGERIRIGYVSGDFNHHSVAFFAEPIVERHDRGRFEVHLYYSNTREDEVTARFRVQADRFHDVAHLEDDKLAEKMRGDKLDILVDLAGHTGSSRLPALMLRPAPVQASYLGYPASTGLDCIDYRITDARCDPPGFEALSSETLARMPESYFCFRPFKNSPEPAPAPGATSGVITFGSFNNLPKLNMAVLDAWRRILAAVPGSRLALKNRALKDAATRKRLASRIGQAGIDIGRVELREPHANAHDHLAAYHGIDVALDTFPYNGATTTCEALWMGVPVVSLAGSRSASRMGASILGSVGLDDMIVDSVDAYVDRAIALACDPSKLVLLHTELRNRIRSSPIMNEKAFVEALEDRYLTMIDDFRHQGRK